MPMANGVMHRRRAAREREGRADRRLRDERGPWRRDARDAQHAERERGRSGHRRAYHRARPEAHAAPVCRARRAVDDVVDRTVHDASTSRPCCMRSRRRIRTDVSLRREQRACRRRWMPRSRARIRGFGATIPRAPGRRTIIAASIAMEERAALRADDAAARVFRVTMPENRADCGLPLRHPNDAPVPQRTPLDVTSAAATRSLADVSRANLYRVSSAARRAGYPTRERLHARGDRSGGRTPSPPAPVVRRARPRRGRPLWCVDHGADEGSRSRDDARRAARAGTRPRKPRRRAREAPLTSPAWRSAPPS